MMSLSIIYSMLLISHVIADEHSHTYNDGEEVVLWMNTISPYHNRQETYRYFSLPFCRGPRKEISHYHETLGEELQGVELEYSGLDIVFKGNVPTNTYCSVKVTEKIYNAFSYAIHNHYWYQMYIDDLPLWAIVGEIEDKDNLKIFTHKKIDIGYHGDQIVEVNFTTQSKTLLTLDTDLSFTYEVNWKISPIQFQNRFNKYLDPSFFQHRIHWFSIFNSFMMVIFLVGLVSMIMLRTLRRDYARYSNIEEQVDIDNDITEDYGWKQIHGDVFRAPPLLTLFTSLIASGRHLGIVSFGCIIFSLVGDLYTQRGSLLSTGIFLYAVTSPVNGYYGGALYSQMGGRRWIRQMICGISLFPLIIVSVVLTINIVAMFYHASRAIPLASMLAVLAIAVFVIVPLHLIGTIFGRNISGQKDIPCRVNTVPRPIPDKRWFIEPFSLSLLGGILPFGSIFIEIYFIFTSFWQYKIYYVYGFMLLVFLIMITVTMCVTIVCIYFLINSEDYRWHWTSFGSGVSISLYVFLYSVYYFFFKTKMYGLFQTIFYFGYSALGAIAIGIICGHCGFIGARYFIRKIYTTVKID